MSILNKILKKKKDKNSIDSHVEDVGEGAIGESDKGSKLNKEDIIKRIKIILDKSSKYAWSIGNVSLVGLCLFFVYQMISGYYQGAEQSIDDGKRVVYFIATGDIDIKKSVSANVESEKSINTLENNDTSNKSPDRKKNAATLSIIIGGVGLSKNTTKDIINLPSAVAISFSPYSPEIKHWVKKAKGAGHEIFLDLPMENTGYPTSDPGSLGLVSFYGVEKNRINLKKILSVTSGYTGLLTPVGEKFTHSLASIIPIIDSIKKSQLSFIYNEKEVSEGLREEISSKQVPVISKYVVIDDVLSRESIEMKLDKIREIIMDGGDSILAVGRPYPVTIKTVASWVEKNKKDGINIVPVSSIKEWR